MKRLIGIGLLVFMGGSAQAQPAAQSSIPVFEHPAAVSTNPSSKAWACDTLGLQRRTHLAIADTARKELPEYLRWRSAIESQAIDPKDVAALQLRELLNQAVGKIIDELNGTGGLDAIQADNTLMIIEALCPSSPRAGQ